jgi:FG-GAP-like repeat/Secretion system C-terminal sorting domain
VDTRHADRMQSALFVTFLSCLAFCLVFSPTSAFADPVEFSDKLVVSDGLVNAISTLAVDMNSDGHLDILTADNYHNTIFWYENLDGQGSYGPEQVIVTNTWIYTPIHMEDVTGDEIKDLLFIEYQSSELRMMEAIDNVGSFGPEQFIASRTWTFKGFDTADLDGDEDVDLVTGGTGDGNRILWHENTDGQGNFGPATQLTVDSEHMIGLECFDVDGDNDEDIVVLSLWEQLWWHENTDGAGTFGQQQSLVPSDNYAKAISFADIDGDQDSDLVVAHEEQNSLVWYENTDGQGTYSAGNEISSSVSGINLAQCADLDGDGDTDILTTFGTFLDYELVWFENLDGSGTFSMPNQIATSTWQFGSLEPVDLDGDSDVDLLCGSEGSQEVFWYRNDGTLGVTDSQSALGLPLSYSIKSIYPNPFNPSTTIEIGLPVPSDLRVSVFNMLGQEVAVLSFGQRTAGYHSFTFDGSDLSSGIYFVRAFVPGEMDEVKKVVLMK